MKHKLGDKVKVKSLDWYNTNKDKNGNVALGKRWYFPREGARFCGMEATIVALNREMDCYLLDISKDDHIAWTDEMFEEESEKSEKSKTKAKKHQPKTKADTKTEDEIIAQLMKDGEELFKAIIGLPLKERQRTLLNAESIRNGRIYSVIKPTLAFVETEDECRFKAITEQMLPTFIAKFKEITEEMRKTFVAKNHDYGNSFEKSLNKRGLISAITRMEDKMNRFDSLIGGESARVNESIYDTLKDLAVYCILTMLWLDKQK